MSLEPTPLLRVTSSIDGASATLVLVGDLDMATGELLRDRIGEVLREHARVSHLVLDLTDLDFLDVTGLGVFVDTQRRLSGVGGQLVLRRPRAMVLRMLTLLKLDRTVLLEP